MTHGYGNDGEQDAPDAAQALKLPMANIARKLVEGLYNFTGSSVTLSCPSINKGVTFWLRSQALEPTEMCLLEINMIVKRKKER